MKYNSNLQYMGRDKEYYDEVKFFWTDIFSKIKKSYHFDFWIDDVFKDGMPIYSLIKMGKKNIAFNINASSDYDDEAWFRVWSKKLNIYNEESKKEIFSLNIYTVPTLVSAEKSMFLLKKLSSEQEISDAYLYTVSENAMKESRGRYAVI